MAHNIIDTIPGRDAHSSRRVAVYKNLHTQSWSIRALDGPHKGRVVGHARTLGLRDCAMHVGQAAQRRIAAGAGREVHAWVVGRIAELTLADPVRLVYHPHERGEFYRADTGQQIITATAVLFTDAAYIDRR